MRPRSAYRLGLFAILCAGLACGEDAPTDRTPEDLLTVSASPRGTPFESMVEVVLFASQPADIYYSLDGTPPSDANAAQYDGGAIRMTDTTLLSFAAKSEAGRWSVAGSELYTRVPPPRDAEGVDRMLRLSATGLFFGPRPGEGIMRRTIDLQSIGTEPVRLDAAYVASDMDAPSLYQPGIFRLETPVAAGTSLPPGESIELRIAYDPTETLRSAALILETNDERLRGGIHRIRMNGRIMTF